MYYRVAIETGCESCARKESCLKWKSTPLTSMQALLQFFRRYHAIPQNHLRVFMSSSREKMDELLAQENNGLAVNSVTEEQFLRDRGICAPCMGIEASTETTPERQVTQVATLIPPVWSANSSSNELFLKDTTVSALERRRFELEMGPGGDHDLPYSFTMPISTPQTLAWIRLLAQVQRGELRP